MLVSLGARATFDLTKVVCVSPSSMVDSEFSWPPLSRLGKYSVNCYKNSLKGLRKAAIAEKHVDFIFKGCLLLRHYIQWLR